MGDGREFKIDPSPSHLPSWFSLKTKASIEIAWLYTYIASSCKDALFWINPIIPNCGVNFMEKAYQYDKIKETAEIFSLPERESSILMECCKRDQLYFPGSRLRVFGQKTRPDWLRFVLNVNEDTIAPGEQQAKLNIDMMRLHPVTITLEDSGRRIDLDFYPGVQCFAPEMDHSKIERHIVYHALLKNSDSNWSQEWGKILIWKLKSPSLRIVGVKAFTICSKGYEVDYHKLQKPFTLLSNDGVTIACHKDVLCDRSPYFANEIMKKTTESTMALSESSHATNLLLEHIYNPLKQLPPNLPLRELCGVLRLAVQFQLYELIASTSNRIFAKTDIMDLKCLWHLCAKLHPLKHKIQIVSKLWETLLFKIRRCILGKKSSMIKFVSFDDPRYFLNLKLFAECGPCKCELLKGLCTDLEKTVDGESQEDYIKIQLLFKRFQSEVLMEFESLENKPISPCSSVSES